MCVCARISILSKYTRRSCGDWYGRNHNGSEVVMAKIVDRDRVGLPESSRIYVFRSAGDIDEIELRL